MARMKALSSLTLEELASRRWTAEKPETEDWFYEEPLKDIQKRLTKFPPYNLDLSDAWVVAILNCSTLSIDDRGINWPAVFTSKGLLRA